VRRVADVQTAGCIVGIIHRRNTAPKPVREAHWTPVPVSEVESLLGGDLTFYRRLAMTTPERHGASSTE
jgi:hypothetical protein